jgi:hypothetical protein
MISTATQVDAEEIAHAMSLFLLLGQVTELRALGVSTPSFRRPHTVSGYFNSVDKFAQAAASIVGAQGIYFCPNPINPALLARASNRCRPIDREPLTGDADIVRRCWLLIDLDAKRPAGISSTDVEHDAAIERARTIRAALSSEGWTPPIFADSGNGGHLDYCINLPVDDGGLVKRCLQALDLRFSDDAVCVDTGVHNPARLWKAYSTWARKGDDILDRPHRLSKILEHPGELEPVPVELLEALAATGPKEEVKATGQSSRPAGHNGQRFNLDRFMETHFPGVSPKPYKGGRIWIIPTCPFSPVHTNSSAFVREDANGIGAGCHHNTCAGLGWKELRELKEPRAYRERGTAHPQSNDGLPPDPSEPYEPSQAEWAEVTDAPEPEPATTKPTFKTASEIMEIHTTLRRPVVHGIVREGETANFISVPKLGKSCLASQLAISRACGRLWLGKFQVEQGDTLIFDNELHIETISYRLPQVGAAMGAMRSEWEHNVCIECLRGKNMDIYGLGRYLQQVEPGRFKLIILDAFYRFMPVGFNENDNAQMTTIYNYIDVIAARLQCAFLLIHHSTKGNQSEKEITAVGAGAGAMSRATDCHLILRPHAEESVAVLDAAVRSWPPIAPFCLRWKFPIWTPADELDPNDLRKPGRPRKQDEVVTPTPSKWTPETFATRFVSVEPKSKRLILASAASEGLSERGAENLLALAEDAGKVFRWTYQGNVSPKFSSTPEPKAKDEQVNGN